MQLIIAGAGPTWNDIKPVLFGGLKPDLKGDKEEYIGSRGSPIFQRSQNAS